MILSAATQQVREEVAALPAIPDRVFAQGRLASDGAEEALAAERLSHHNAVAWLHDLTEQVPALTVHLHDNRRGLMARDVGHDALARLAAKVAVPNVNIRGAERCRFHTAQDCPTSSSGRGTG